MAEYQTPELLRTPLEELCLQIKSLKLGACRGAQRKIEPQWEKSMLPNGFSATVCSSGACLGIASTFILE